MCLRIDACILLASAYDPAQDVAAIALLNDKIELKQFDGHKEPAQQEAVDGMDRGAVDNALRAVDGAVACAFRHYDN